jgi:glycine cleavage system H protein
MAKPLVFMMGRSPAFLPTDREYARNHMWALGAEDGYRVGLSAYAVKLLGDLRLLDWSAEAGAAVTAGQQIGFIEGSKATSDLYAPMGGTVQEINDAVVADPTLINSNLYDAGWLMMIAGNGEGLLSPEDYLSHLEASWPLAQRILKGQLRGRP